MRLIAGCILAFCLVAPGLAPPTHAEGASSFETVTGYYESIRQALLHDTVEGVPAHAERIRELASTLRSSDLDARTAGVDAGKLADLGELMPTIVETAERLAAATTLDDSREAFHELSRAMVRYRQMAIDPSPVVVFCPMAKAVWLQPDEQIGNPYHGQSMPRCGEVVSQ